MATCPNKNLKEWKDLVSSEGEDMAYFLWDQYDGVVPVDAYVSKNLDKLSFKEVESVSNLILNKLGIKKRGFHKRDRSNIKEDYWYNSDSYIASETALNLFKDITGVDLNLRGRSVEDIKNTIRESVDTKDFIKIWEKTLRDTYEWESFNQGKTTELHNNKRIIKGYLARKDVQLEAYSKENQEVIKQYLPSLFKDNRYKSAKQARWFAGSKAITKLDREIGHSRQIDQLFNFKKSGRMKKYSTLLNWVTIDPDWRARIKSKINNEIDRRVAFRKQEVDKNPGILSVLKVRSLLMEAGQDMTEHRLRDQEVSENIDKYFDTINYYAETEEVVGESDTVSVLEKIIELDGTYSDLAQKILPFAKKNNVAVSFLNKVPGRPAGRYGAEIIEGKVKNQDVFIDYTSQNYQKEPERLLMHELVHSITSLIIAEKNYLAEEANKDASIKQFMDYIKETVQVEQDKPFGMFYQFTAPYGFTNEAEFVSEVLTNPEFAELLRELPAMNTKEFKSLFEEILNWITNLFKIEKYSNAYDQALEVVDGLLQEQLDRVVKMAEEDSIENDQLADAVEKTVLMEQSEDMPMSEASPETITKIKEAAKKMGISLTDLASYLKGNKEITSTGINALADLTKGVIAIATGKEGVALTEEMVHVATAILEQTNPSLVSAMISKIGKFEIFKTTLEAYKDKPSYQLKSGKPDIRKIKKEAVDKLIAELIILQNEGSTEFPELLEEANRSMFRTFWQKILNFFNVEYTKANIDIFKEAADKIVNEDIGSVEDIAADYADNIFLQISEKQKEIQQRILDTKKYVERIEQTEEEAEVDPVFLDTEKTTNWYEFKNADGTRTKITKRVTDRVKRWYKNKFGDKDFSGKQKEMNEFKRDQGTKYHKYFEEIHARYFNLDGTRKTNLDPRPSISDNKDRNIYNKLEKYFTELIDSYSQEGRNPLVLSEAILYDPKEKEAGTVDLIIVEPNGKTHIYDWKFMSVASGAKDVAWFKQGAYNIQLKTYKNMLQNYYGVEEIGKNRAIPILFDIRNNKKGVGINKTVTPFVNDIAIGSVNTAEIEDLKLLPVSEETESTEIPEIDDLLKQLNAVHSKISSVKVASDEEKEFKKQRLNVLREAVRVIQGTLNVEPLVDVISTMKREGENIISDYNTIFKNASVKDGFSEKELSDFSETLQDYMAIGEVFGSIGDSITKIFYKPGSENLAITKKQKETVLYNKQLAEKIQAESTEIRVNTKEIKELSGDFAEKFIGVRNLVNGLMGVAKEIKSIGSWFRGISELSLPATDVLFKVVTNSKAKASRDAFKRVEKLMEIRDRIMARGSDGRSTISKIYQKDKDGKKTNKVIYKYDRKFYETVDNLAQDPDRSIKALKTYIDVDGYMKEARLMLDKRIVHIRRSYIDSTLIEKLILEERQKYDINDINFNGFSNYILKKHPKEAWISEEYKEIQKDKDLFDLYNFISETNQKANEIGYIENKVKNTFLPYIRKGFAESLAWDFSLKAIGRITDDLTIRPDDVGFGAVDSLTKELVNTVPKYYTHDFTRKEDGTTDMSEVSEDLFKNLALYVTHIERYKYLSDVEGQLTLVKKIESFKDSYKSSIVGNVILDDNGEPEKVGGNQVNTKLYTNFLNALLYGQKYPISATDLPLNTGKAVEFGKSLITMVTGKKFEKNENPTVTSMMKTIDAGNQYFQLKTLGFSLLAGAANLFGTTIQINTQSGIYFRAREYAKNSMKLIGNKFTSGEERDMFVQLVDVFMPLKDDPSYEKIKASGMTKLTQSSFSDLAFVFMRNPEFLVEKSIFLTLLENSMVNEEGRIVNIREFVKSKNPSRYKKSSEFRSISKKIEEEITELKNTKSIQKTKKLVNGKLEIPGLDLTNQDELQRLTNLTRRLSRNATGSLSDSDINQISMNIFGKSAMVFKGWIPKLVDTRFGEFRKVSDDFSMEINEDGLTTGEKYDIGRVRLLGYVIGTSIRDKAANITNILQFNDKGLLALDKMYEDFAQNYMKRTGKKLAFNQETGEYTNFINKEEFIDLIRTNLRNQIKELGILLTLFAVTVAIPPPDEDMSKSEKNFYRFTEKVVHRFVSELSFFYNPAEYQRLLGQSAFPVLGIASDIKKFIIHSSMELTGLDLSNPDLTKEQVYKKAQPIKYGAKMVPFAKELLNYGAMIDDEFAKDFDINITNRNR